MFSPIQNHNIHAKTETFFSIPAFAMNGLFRLLAAFGSLDRGLDLFQFFPHILDLMEQLLLWNLEAITTRRRGGVHSPELRNVITRTNTGIEDIGGRGSALLFGSENGLTLQRHAI